MGNLCSAPQRIPEASRKESIVYKTESNKMLYEVVHGDICTEKVDALVNPSNSKLQSTGGVSQLIAEKGGEKLQEEVNKAMKDTEVLEIGTVVVTNGGSLSAKHVIHVAMPVWRGGAEQEVEQFVTGIKNALMEADKLGVKSIAIPAVGGSGVGGFPREEATKGLINACVEYSKETSTKTVESIRFVSNDFALVKFLQEFVEDTLSPKKEGETVAHPNHTHVEDPKGHSPQATTDIQSEQPTSPTKDESHQHSEAHPHHHDHAHGHTHEHHHDHAHEHAHEHHHEHAHEEHAKTEHTSTSHEESKKEEEHHHAEHKTEEHVEKHVEEVATKEHHEEVHHHEEAHHEEAHHHEAHHHEEAHHEEAHHHEAHHEKEVHESKPEENQESESQPQENEVQETN